MARMSARRPLPKVYSASAAYPSPSIRRTTPRAMRAAAAGRSGSGSVMPASCGAGAPPATANRPSGGGHALSRAIALFISLAMSDLRATPPDGESDPAPGDTLGVPAAAVSRPGVLSRAWRRGKPVAALLLAGSIALAALYAVVPPPLTPLMVLRLFEGEGIRKDWTAYDDMSPNLVRAVIAAEDARFCEHWGFDFTAIRRALEHNEESK